MEPRIEISRRDELSPSTQEQVRTIATTVDWGQAPDYEWSGCEWGIHVWLGEELASDLGLLARTVLVGDQPVRIAGVGGVKTRPELQGRGYASAMLRRAAEFMREELDAEFGLLFCLDDRIPFYLRFGWEMVTAPVYLECRGEKVINAANTMYLPLRDHAWPEGPVDIQGPPW